MGGGAGFWLVLAKPGANPLSVPIPFRVDIAHMGGIGDHLWHLQVKCRRVAGPKKSAKKFGTAPGRLRVRQKVAKMAPLAPQKGEK